MGNIVFVLVLVLVPIMIALVLVLAPITIALVLVPISRRWIIILRQPHAGGWRARAPSLQRAKAGGKKGSKPPESKEALGANSIRNCVSHRGC